MNRIKCLAIYKGHTQNVTSVSFAPKKALRFVSASQDNTIKVWNCKDMHGKAQGGEPVEVNQAEMTVMAHQKSINVAKFSPNDKLIASASQDKTIKIWSADELKLVMQLKGHLKGIWDIDFSPADKQLVSVSGDKLIKVWNLSGDKGQCVATLQGHNDQLVKVKWINEGLQIASASVDGVVKLWNLKKQHCVNTYEMHSDKIWAMDLFETIQKVEASDEDESTFKSTIQLITGGSDSTLKVWQDNTLEHETEQRKSFLQRVEEEQKLSHLMRDKDFLNAALLSFRLNKVRDFNLILQKIYTDSNQANEDEVDSVVNDMRQFSQLASSDFKDSRKPKTSKQGLVNKLVQALLKEDRTKLLTLIRNLNAKFEYCEVAQHLLGEILPILHNEMDAEIDPKAEDRKLLRDMMAAIEGYNHKHYTRVEKHLTNSYFVNYIVSQMTLNEDVPVNKREAKKIRKQGGKHEKHADSKRRKLSH